MKSVEFMNVNKRDIAVGRIEIDHEMFDVIPRSLINTFAGATKLTLVNTNTKEETDVDEFGADVKGVRIQAHFDQDEDSTLIIDVFH